MSDPQCSILTSEKILALHDCLLAWPTPVSAWSALAGCERVDLLSSTFVCTAFGKNSTLNHAHSTSSVRSGTHATITLVRAQCAVGDRPSCTDG